MTPDPCLYPASTLPVICVSSIDWDFVWQGHQEIMSRFAARGQRVLFLENTGVRAPRLSDGPRIWRRLINWRKGWAGIREEAPNLYVYSPLVLPYPNFSPVVQLNSILVLRTIRRWMKELGIRDMILFTWLPTGIARSLVEALDPAATVYFCCDNFASRTADAAKIEASENALLARTDLVLAHGIRLQERLVKKHPQVVLMQYGISEALFSQAVDHKHEKDPKKTAGLVYGYVGGLHEHVDQELLVGLAKQYPDAEVRLIGPSQCDISSLRMQPNIRILGQRPHRDLPGYICDFDVGLIPYRKNSYTETVFPTKLTEYLACGIPVLSTDIPEVVAFEKRHPGSVLCAKDSLEFFKIAEPGRIMQQEMKKKDLRRHIAMQNTWGQKLRSLDSMINKVLEKNYQKRKLIRWQRHHQSRLRLLMPAAVVLLTLFLMQTSIFWLVADLMLIPDGKESAEAVVVFGGGAGEGGVAGNGYIERTLHGVELIRQHRAQELILASGENFVIPEAKLMRGVALEAGLSPEKIHLESGGGGTREMAHAAGKIMRQSGWHKALIVTSPYHERRAIQTWMVANPDLAAIPAKVPMSNFYGYQEGKAWHARNRPSFVQVKAWLQEFMTLLYYRTQKFA
jgi:uncharacterized SAM-binding protein YcdF (DUF218 family)/glycosyltransferase involved in cell wall biosynthesis